MKILIFKKTLMQRYRALLHILDELLDAGHEVFAYRRGGKQGSISKGGKQITPSEDYNPATWYKAPWDIDCASSGAIHYMARQLGIEVKGINKIQWADPRKGKVKPDLILGTDYVALKSTNQINIPYNDFFCKTYWGDALVGNGMCESFKKRQNKVEEVKGQLLIPHPGGGRTILSPLRDHIAKWEVIENNIKLFRKMLKLLPSTITKVIIKIHPAPYLYCDITTFEEKVMSKLYDEFDVDIEVVNSDMLGHMCKSEYILTLGSSTTIWLLGSDKKWLNITECAKYDLDSKKRRDKQERTKNWQYWPQNITFEEMTDALSDYNNFIQWSDDGLILQKLYNGRFNMNCTENIIEVIDNVGRRK